MADSARDREAASPRRVLIPLDADEALVALSRFSYTAERSPERDAVTSSAARRERRGSRGSTSWKSSS